MEPRNPHDDSNLNPGQSHTDEKFSDPKNNQTNENSDEQNTQRDNKLKEQELGITNPNKEGSIGDQEERGNWRDNTNKDPSVYGGKLADSNRRMSWANIKAIGKKRGPIGAIIAVLLFGTAGFGGLFSGASLLINMKEQLTNNLMGSTSTIFNVNGRKLFSYKIERNLTSGACNTVEIRCKFKTMSEKQIRNLEKSGNIKVVRDGVNLTGRRAKVVGLEYKGGTLEANNVRLMASNDVEFQAELRRGGFNPRAYSVRTTAFMNLMDRVGISKRSALPDTKDKEALRRAVRENVAGTKAAFERVGLRSAPDAEDGSKMYFDTDGSIIDENTASTKVAGIDAEFAKLVEKKKAAIKLGDVVGKVTKATVKGTLLVGTGLVDSACTAWTVVRTAGFAAKYLGSLQMIRYSYVFLNTADKIKAGDATPEEVEYLANIITSENASGVSGMESRGWNYAMYGDVTAVPELGQGAKAEGDYLDEKSAASELEKREVTDYVNGQITSDSFMADLANLAGSGGETTQQIDEKCGFVSSPTGQAIIIGVGVAALAGCIATAVIGVGAACLTANTIVQASISLTIGVTLAFITPWLVSLATDSIINGDENGNQAMNAIVSGAGALDASGALASGGGYLAPADAAYFQKQTEESNNQIAAIDRAQSGQFDASNPESFLGKLVGFIAPSFVGIKGLSGFFSSFASIASTSLSTFSSAAYAKSYGDAGVCRDPDYKRYGIATDINCNAIVGQSQSTFNLDIDDILDYMVGVHMNAQGDAISTEYQSFLENCVNRDKAVGSFEEGQAVTADITGEICIDKPENEMYNYFRAYQSYLLLNQMMDDEDTTESAYDFYTPNSTGVAGYWSAV